MRLAEPFVHKGRVMLASDKLVNEADIDILQRRFPQALVKVADPILDGLVQFEDDQQDREVARQAQGRIAETMAEVGKSIGGRASLSGKDFRAMESAALEVMRYLAEHPVSAALVNRTMRTETFLADHAGAVFYLSMVLGSTVKGYVVQERIRQTAARNIRSQTVFDLVPLGLASMFMDLSLYPLAEIYDVENPTLTETEAERFRNHPALSAEMLPEVFPATARAVVRTHHENHAGEGYPDALEPDKLHIFARIIRICDAFAAVTATEVFPNALSPCRALWEMMRGGYRRYFDPVLMPLFARLIQPFPIGAKVQLADGREAVVVRYNRMEPFKPTIIIAFDPDGSRLPPDRIEGPISLREREDLRIAGFAGEDLSFLHQPQVEPDLEQATPDGALSLGLHRRRRQRQANARAEACIDPDARFMDLLGVLFP